MIAFYKLLLKFRNREIFKSNFLILLKNGSLRFIYCNMQLTDKKLHLLLVFRELPGHNQEESHPAHQEKDNECYESQDELEAPVRTASKPRVTKQVTFDSSELHTTSKKPISSIGASTSFSWWPELLVLLIKWKGSISFHWYWKGIDLVLFLKKKLVHLLRNMWNVFIKTGLSCEWTWFICVHAFLATWCQSFLWSSLDFSLVKDFFLLPTT